MIANRLLLEFDIEEVIEEIKTKLNKENIANILIGQNNSKFNDKLRNIRGEVIKKNTDKFMKIIKFLIRIINSRANLDIKYC